MIRLLIQPHMFKMVSSIFSAMSWLKFTSTTRASLPSMPSTERMNGEKVSVARGSDYRDYTSWFSTTNTGVLPSAQTCRFPCQHCRVWLQLWHQPVCPIIPVWVCHPLSQNCHSPGVYPSMIYYGPGGWKVCCIQFLRGGLVEQRTGVHHTLCCDMRWLGLLCCRKFCDVHWRMCHSRHILYGVWGVTL